VNPSGTGEPGKKRMRRSASAAILLWVVVLLLGAAIGRGTSAAPDPGPASGMLSGR